MLLLSFRPKNKIPASSAKAGEKPMVFQLFKLNSEKKLMFQLFQPEWTPCLCSAIQNVGTTTHHEVLIRLMVLISINILEK